LVKLDRLTLVLRRLSFKENGASLFAKFLQSDRNSDAIM